MRFSILVILLFPVVLFAQQFEEKTTNSSNVRLNVSNIGTFGNSFRGYRDGTDAPSLEYPAGSGIEHLFESGIWIGGIDPNGAPRVSTSAIDNPQGYRTGQAGFEFTSEAGDRFIERSNLTNSPSYALDAVSNQDFVSTYTDRNILIPGTQIQISNHQQPMNIDVTEEVYNWNFSFSDFFVLLNFTVENVGTETFDDMYVALWSNTVVRNVNITPAGAGGSAFYDKGGNGYVDSLNMAYCYDAAGDVGFTDSYVAQRFLGATDKFGFKHPDLDSAFNVNYRVWQFNDPSNVDPFFRAPADDNQRHEWMKTPTEESPCWNSLDDQVCANRTETFEENINRPGNRSDLVAAGPFNDFAPGDKITFSYAFVLAKKFDDGNPVSANTFEQKLNLFNNAEWAQTAFNGEDVNFNGVLDPGEDTDGNGEITRFILPTPPDIPETKIIPDANKVDIYWTDNAEKTVDPITNELDFEGYRIYLSKLGFDVTDGVRELEFVPIAEYDIANNGFEKEIGLESIRLDNPVTFEGDDKTYYYKYTIDNLLSGWQYAVAVSAFDRGNAEAELPSLESSPLANDFRIFAGTPPNEDIKTNEPFVYPNPYYAGAAWEGRSNFQEESRRIVFANLPEECTIRVFSPAGDLIDEFKHYPSYDGTDIRWFRTFGDEDNPDQNIFSGGEHSWDLLSRDNQIISRGVYLFTVTDQKTNKISKGKFVVIK